VKAYDVQPEIIANWKQAFLENAFEGLVKNSIVAEYEKRIADLK
jgi:hypothetical protein